MGIFLDLKEITNAAEFAENWSSRYKYGLDGAYEENIQRPLTEDRLLNLFKWKNGNENIAKLKRSSVDVHYLPLLNESRRPSLTCPDDGRHHLQGLGGGPIWGIFWLHCNEPDLFPILDQHTYRAMEYIKNGSVKELPSKKEEILNIYFDEYIPFFQEHFSNVNRRKTDKALFTFGKILRTIKIEK